MKEGIVYKGNKIRRFSTARIIEHWVVVAAFGILITTGLSQKFYGLDISQWLIAFLGGIDNVRLTHRYTGIAFSMLMLVHVAIGMFGVFVKKWEPSMLIKRKDFADVIQNIQYYIGAKNQPARCDRYDYRQKFDYWTILFSGILMTATGFILWFPAFFTGFIQGEIIPAAKILHTNQAFLAFLIIAVWHIYNSIFSPEVFPIDTSIFTGAISRGRMSREHPLEYERLLGTALGQPEITEDLEYEDIAREL